MDTKEGQAIKLNEEMATGHCKQTLNLASQEVIKKNQINNSIISRCLRILVWVCTMIKIYKVLLMILIRSLFSKKFIKLNLDSYKIMMKIAQEIKKTRF